MSRRAPLAQAVAGGDTHAGLWLDRYVPDLGATAAAGNHLDKALAVLKVPEGYLDFFRRYEAAVGELPPHTLLADATVRGRLALGLGAESVLETAVTLHHTWGVPYLPGSALKGLAARAARQQLDAPWAADSAPYLTLFGSTETAGYVTFHDALWIPFDRKGAAIQALPLYLDVMTVHHADYYAGKPVPPADWDDPSPVPFLTAHGTYLLALTGPPRWVELALTILGDAMRHDGLGAKTAAGYGRMTVKAREAATAGRA